MIRVIAGGKHIVLRPNSSQHMTWQLRSIEKIDCSSSAELFGCRICHLTKFELLLLIWIFKLEEHSQHESNRQLEDWIILVLRRGNSLQE